MFLYVDEPVEDVRYKVGAAVEYNRRLDLTIGGAGADVEIDTVRLDRELGKMVVSMVVPNEFRIKQLVVPYNDNAQAVIELYPGAVAQM